MWLLLTDVSMRPKNLLFSNGKSAYFPNALLLATSIGECLTAQSFLITLAVEFEQALGFLLMAADLKSFYIL